MVTPMPFNDLSQPQTFLQFRFKDSAVPQGCQIFLGSKYQNGKNLPNDHKIYQIFSQYTK
jgi:hypothetical protein